MTTTSRKQRLLRICAAWVAISYSCLTLIVPFHQHQHAKPAASPISNTAVAVEASGHGSAGISGATATVHCAACEWEAIVGSQIAHGYMISAQAVDVTPKIAAPIRALRFIAFATSSRGPPLA